MPTLLAQHEPSAAAHYDAWYHTASGRWIGAVEYQLLARLLRAQPGEHLLDVGCGTGHFARSFARAASVDVTGIDPDLPSLEFARRHAQPAEHYVLGRAEDLPFADRSFDRTLCVTALGFVDDEPRAVREMLRVTRKRLVLGLLNRRSLLHLQRGRRGGTGGYRGAHWHTAAEALQLFDALPVHDIELRSAVLIAGKGWVSRKIERCVPEGCLWGGFLAIAASPSAPQPQTYDSSCAALARAAEVDVAQSADLCCIGACLGSMLHLRKQAANR
jgi:SAM-dependent methyltransferase